MKVKEEFLLEEIKEYLDENITVVIANPSPEERKNYRLFMQPYAYPV